MRNPWKPTLWALAVLAAASAAWWTAGQWLPQVRPWAEKTWSQLTRPGADTLPTDKKAVQGSAAGARGAASAPVAPQPRKCLQGGRTTYTDQPCPPGSQEQAVDGSVTSFPRTP